MSKEVNNTMNLPKTDFPMRASLPQREPGMVKAWQENKIYEKMIARNEGKPTFILHDGPPYANASIHLGTALNKVLKDMIIRSKNMCGYYAPYIPGWDTHGLPIELKALAKLGPEKKVTPVELRHHCRDFALQHVGLQMEQFKRLGALADYEHPYITLKNEFEAKQIELFGAMAKKDFIYKGLKPVYWCPDCQTALAEAEIEYQDDPNTSIYVKFLVKNDNGVLTKLGADLSKTYVIIWTTTTWTLPGNVANCLGPKYDYNLVKASDGNFYVVANELMASTMEAGGIESYEVLGSFKGIDLDNGSCYHPFLDRETRLIVGDHVTLDSGTGIVHTAPGHGQEDYEVCVNHYPDLPIIVPVDNKGHLNELAGQFAGLSTDEANKVILQHLKDTGALFASQNITHQYPHCWRCKKPIIFRATEQWFCSVDAIKDEAIKAIEGVHWIPEWGEGRMVNMVRDRSDWCISRQRTWGVPIPMFKCEDCGKYVVNDETLNAVSDLFREKGSDEWFVREAKDILPEGFKCPHCGGSHFQKEKDIMDVWFDSGVTHAAVLDTDDFGHKWPADLYIEGADQYRGWFQSSLLTSVAWKGKAPYKEVCTHGWVVDGEGKKMSKSLGNGMLPSEITDNYGADILRLWVASSDYHSDIRVSKEILKQLSEVYRKIRNTARFILSNLYDFNPDTDSVKDEELFELDRWAIERVEELAIKARESYRKYEFFTLYHAVHNFCTIDMSNFYLDILKDRLYCEGASSTERRAAQTAIYRILRDLMLICAPMIPFTAEEVWSYMPKSEKLNMESIMFNDMPNPSEEDIERPLLEKWGKIYDLRFAVNKCLEAARANKLIGKSLEAKVVLHAEGEVLDFLKANRDILKDAFIVSQVEITDEKGGVETDVEGLSVEIVKASGCKCERCWSYSETVGQDKEFPTLCYRCANVVRK